MFCKLSFFVGKETCNIWLHLLWEKRLGCNSVLLWKRLMISQNVLCNSYGDKILGYSFIDVPTWFYAWGSSEVLFIYSFGTGVLNSMCQCPEVRLLRRDNY